VPADVVIVTVPVLPPAGAVTDSDVAVALVTVAAVPLNFTVLPAMVASKLLPVIVTAVPAGPDTGLMDAITGAGAEGVGLFFLHPVTVIIATSRNAKIKYVLIKKIINDKV
jgi:hypothetical protein